MVIKLYKQGTTTPEIHADFPSSSFQHYGGKISLVSLDQRLNHPALALQKTRG